MAVFDRGDIVRACLNPTAGNELQGDMRPCLVLSPKAFNKLGLTLIAPITQGGNYARFQGFAISLMGTGTETQGVILIMEYALLILTLEKLKRLNQCLAKYWLRHWRYLMQY